MTQTKITTNETDVFIECPYCKMTEQHPIDEQRSHLQEFEVMEWKDDVDGENEHSIMKCHMCFVEFDLEWDYENKEL